MIRPINYQFRSLYPKVIRRYTLQQNSHLLYQLVQIIPNLANFRPYYALCSERSTFAITKFIRGGNQQNPKVTAGYRIIKMHTVKVQQKQLVRQFARYALSTITRHRKQSWGMCTKRNNYSAFADFLPLQHYSLTISSKGTDKALHI
jgi:hypothetical protein